MRKIEVLVSFSLLLLIGSIQLVLANVDPMTPPQPLIFKNSMQENQSWLEERIEEENCEWMTDPVKQDRCMARHTSVI